MMEDLKTEAVKTTNQLIDMLDMLEEGFGYDFTMDELNTLNIISIKLNKLT